MSAGVVSARGLYPPVDKMTDACEKHYLSAKIDETAEIKQWFHMIC